MNNEITILTPTFNRANTLPKLYDSLKKQVNKNFDWLIIDDGSADKTRTLVEHFIEEKLIDIKYVYQKNGGKGRALNNGFSKCGINSIITVVDSDDYLLPTATETIFQYKKKYIDKTNIGGFFFQYNTPAGDLLRSKGKTIKKDELLTRYEYNNEYKQNDGCVCYFKKALINYKYPEFQGENYIGPTVIQMEMSEKYKVLFSPQVVGVAEYLEDGLSKNGRKLRLQNPEGMIYYSKLMMSSNSSVLTQLKYSISIWPYAIITKKTFLETIKINNKKTLLVLSFLPGVLLYLKWKKFL